MPLISALGKQRYEDLCEVILWFPQTHTVHMHFLRERQTLREDNEEVCFKVFSGLDVDNDRQQTLMYWDLEKLEL